MAEQRSDSRSNFTTGDAQQFLTFTLGQEEYGVEILRVQEIKGFSAITPLPNAPTYMKGMLNLRGAIIPIIDLRKKFGLPEVEYTKFTVIVVVQVRGQVMGFVVDAVSDVLQISGTDIQPTLDLYGQVDTSFVNRLARVGEKLVIILDIEKVLTTAETSTASHIAAEARVN